MVYVIASIRVQPGCLSRFLEIFKSNMPAVRAEKDASSTGLQWMLMLACRPSSLNRIP